MVNKNLIAAVSATLIAGAAADTSRAFSTAPASYGPPAYAAPSYGGSSPSSTCDESLPSTTAAATTQPPSQPSAVPSEVIETQEVTEFTTICPG